MTENNKIATEAARTSGQGPSASGMTRKIKVIVAAAIIIVVLVAGGALLDRYWIQPATAHSSTAHSHPAGSTDPLAPAFTLTDIFGQKLSLQQYRGKVVLLDFWATWCGPCQTEIPGFIQLQNRYGGQGLQIVGISEDQDGVGGVIEFYKKFKMNYPVALDNGQVGELYGGIIGLPTTFLIGRDGRIYEMVPGAVGADAFEPGIETLLAAPPKAPVTDFRPIEGSESAEVETPAQVNSPVPGIDVTKLSKSGLAKYEEQLSNQQCQCGCKMSVLQCRKEDPGCGTSRQMAQETMQKLSKEGK